MNSRVLGVATRLRLLSSVQSRYSSTVEAKQTLILTENCIQRIKSIQDDQNYLRLIVDSGGCSGFQYKFQLDSNSLAADDCMIDKDGAKLVIDQTSLDLIRGSTVDFSQELIRSSFRVQNNPQAELGCSCGASFSLKI